MKYAITWPVTRISNIYNLNKIQNPYQQLFSYSLNFDWNNIWIRRVVGSRDETCGGWIKLS